MMFESLYTRGKLRPGDLEPACAAHLEALPPGERQRKLPATLCLPVHAPGKWQLTNGKWGTW